MAKKPSQQTVSQGSDRLYAPYPDRPGASRLDIVEMSPGDSDDGGLSSIESEGVKDAMVSLTALGIHCIVVDFSKEFLKAEVPSSPQSDGFGVQRDSLPPVGVVTRSESRRREGGPFGVGDESHVRGRGGAPVSVLEHADSEPVNSRKRKHSSPGAERPRAPPVPGSMLRNESPAPRPSRAGSRSSQGREVPDGDPGSASIGPKATEPDPGSASTGSKATEPDPRSASTGPKATEPDPGSASTGSKATEPDPRSASTGQKATEPDPVPNIRYFILVKSRPRPRRISWANATLRDRTMDDLFEEVGKLAEVKDIRQIKFTLHGLEQDYTAKKMDRRDEVAFAQMLDSWGESMHEEMHALVNANFIFDIVLELELPEAHNKGGSEVKDPGTSRRARKQYSKLIF